MRLSKAIVAEHAIREGGMAFLFALDSFGGGAMMGALGHGGRMAIDHFSPHVVKVDPRDFKADFGGEEIIVIGIRRRTPTGKLITGSQAQRILLDANCPVLAVKAAY